MSEATDWASLPGRLIVVSGPSGSGKTTIVDRLLERPELNLHASVSATTREPRPGEREGVDYFFVEKPVHVDRASHFDDLFLESAEYNGNVYGTPREQVLDALAQGRNVVLIIEVRGALQIRDLAPETLFAFIRPPRFDDLGKRLRKRGTESAAAIQDRLVIARRELAEAHWYDAQIINDSLDDAVEELGSLIQQHIRGGLATDA